MIMGPAYSRIGYWVLKTAVHIGILIRMTGFIPY